MNSDIELNECPQKLQNAVARYLEQIKQAKVISVQKWSDTPFKDKSITQDRFMVLIENVNYYTVYRIALCSKPEWSDEVVRENSMLAGEIIQLVKHSELLRDLLKINEVY